MSERQKCAVCDRDLCIRWTLTHGRGACVECGLPYLVLHYENNKFVDKPASPLVAEYCLLVMREYFAKHKKNVAPGWDGVGADCEDVELWEEFCLPELDKAKAALQT